MGTLTNEGGEIAWKLRLDGAAKCLAQYLTPDSPEWERVFYRPGWWKLGRGGARAVRELMATLQAAGYQPVGYGVPPEGTRVVYGPTGAKRPGGPSVRSAYWFGRWYRPDPACRPDVSSGPQGPNDVGRG